jgi:hypothetical protein
MSDRLSPLWLFADVTAWSARGAGHRRAGQAERAAGSLLVTASALASCVRVCDAVRSFRRDRRGDGFQFGRSFWPLLLQPGSSSRSWGLDCFTNPIDRNTYRRGRLFRLSFHWDLCRLRDRPVRHHSDIRGAGAFTAAIVARLAILNVLGTIGLSSHLRPLPKL